MACPGCLEDKCGGASCSGGIQYGGRSVSYARGNAGYGGGNGAYDEEEKGYGGMI